MRKINCYWTWCWAWREPAGYGLGVYITGKALTVDLILGTFSVEFGDQGDTGPFPG